MKERSVSWNPWHGCTKYSSGCRFCYVYRQDGKYNPEINSSLCKKNNTFSLPVKKKRDGSYKYPEGTFFYTCFTSDFLLKDADEWREECWRMIRERKDCHFLFFTKRIERLKDCLPEDWGEGYENVTIGCTVEDQDRANFRLPIFRELPVIHRSIIAEPLLERLDLSVYLDDKIESVTCGGESGDNVRPCDYDWVLQIRKQCIEKKIPFHFHQTGAYFIKNGKMYHIERAYQQSQARKANIDYQGVKNET